MRCALLFVGLLATAAQGYHSAQIRWCGRPGKKLFLVPTVPLDGIATPKQLALKKKIGSKVPYFITNEDNTISCGDSNMRWCLEASGAEPGDVVRVNHCTRRPTQKWRWLPWGLIQLAGTNLCIHLNEHRGFAAAIVELSECANKAKDMWVFEDTAPALARSSLQSPASSFLPIGASMMVTALGLGVWMWRQREAVMVDASKGCVPLKVDHGGICLIASIAVRSNEITMNNNDRDVMLAEVTKNGYALAYASEDLQNDRDAVLAAVTQNSLALQFACKDLKNDRDIVLAAVTKKGFALLYASEDLKNDRDVVLAAVTENSSALQFASEDMNNDRDVVLAAVSKKGYMLENASQDLKNDRDVVLAAVTEKGFALKYASEDLKNDREIVLAAITENGSALQFASEDLKNDQDVALAAVTQNNLALRHVSEYLQNDVNFSWKVYQICNTI